MKRFWLVFVCVCLLSLINPQIPMIESSGIPSVPLALADALADEVTVPLALADKATLPPPPPGPVEPNPPPAFPPEPQPPAITHLSGQSRELELEIGNRILGFCAAEKEAIRSGDEAGLADFFSTVSEQKRIGDSLEVIESVWPPYIDSRQEEDKGTRRLDHEIDAVSYTHLRAHETRHDLVCRLLLEKKNKNKKEGDKQPAGSKKTSPATRSQKTI